MITSKHGVKQATIGSFFPPSSSNTLHAPPTDPRQKIVSHTPLSQTKDTQTTLSSHPPYTSSPTTSVNKNNFIHTPQKSTSITSINKNSSSLSSSSHHASVQKISIPHQKNVTKQTQANIANRNNVTKDTRLKTNSAQKKYTSDSIQPKHPSSSTSLLQTSTPPSSQLSLMTTKRSKPSYPSSAHILSSSESSSSDDDDDDDDSDVNETLHTPTHNQYSTAHAPPPSLSSLQDGGVPMSHPSSSTPFTHQELVKMIKAFVYYQSQETKQLKKSKTTLKKMVHKKNEAAAWLTVWMYCRESLCIKVKLPDAYVIKKQQQLSTTNHNPAQDDQPNTTNTQNNIAHAQNNTTHTQNNTTNIQNNTNHTQNNRMTVDDPQSHPLMSAEPTATPSEYRYLRFKIANSQNHLTTKLIENLTHNMIDDHGNVITQAIQHLVANTYLCVQGCDQYSPTRIPLTQKRKKVKLKAQASTSATSSSNSTTNTSVLHHNHTHEQTIPAYVTTGHFIVRLLYDWIQNAVSVPRVTLDISKSAPRAPKPRVAKKSIPSQINSTARPSSHEHMDVDDMTPAAKRRCAPHGTAHTNTIHQFDPSAPSLSIIDSRFVSSNSVPTTHQHHANLDESGCMAPEEFEAIHDPSLMLLSSMHDSSTLNERYGFEETLIQQSHQDINHDLVDRMNYIFNEKIGPLMQQNDHDRDNDQPQRSLSKNRQKSNPKKRKRSAKAIENDRQKIIRYFNDLNCYGGKKPPVIARVLDSDTSIATSQNNVHHFTPSEIFDKALKKLVWEDIEVARLDMYQSKSLPTPFKSTHASSSTHASTSSIHPPSQKHIPVSSSNLNRLDDTFQQYYQMTHNVSKMEMLNKSASTMESHPLVNSITGVSHKDGHHKNSDLQDIDYIDLNEPMYNRLKHNIIKWLDMADQQTRTKKKSAANKSSNVTNPQENPSNTTHESHINNGMTHDAMDVSHSSSIPSKKKDEVQIIAHPDIQNPFQVSNSSQSRLYTENNPIQDSKIKNSETKNAKHNTSTKKIPKESLKKNKMDLDKNDDDGYEDNDDIDTHNQHGNSHKRKKKDRQVDAHRSDKESDGDSSDDDDSHSEDDDLIDQESDGELEDDSRVHKDGEKKKSRQKKRTKKNVDNDDGFDNDDDDNDGEDDRATSKNKHKKKNSSKRNQKDDDDDDNNSDDDPAQLKTKKQSKHKKLSSLDDSVEHDHDDDHDESMKQNDENDHDGDINETPSTHARHSSNSQRKNNQNDSYTETMDDNNGLNLNDDDAIDDVISLGHSFSQLQSPTSSQISIHDHQRDGATSSSQQARLRSSSNDKLLRLSAPHNASNRPSPIQSKSKSQPNSLQRAKSMNSTLSTPTPSNSSTNNVASTKVLPTKQDVDQFLQDYIPRYWQPTNKRGVRELIIKHENPQQKMSIEYIPPKKKIRKVTLGEIPALLKQVVYKVYCKKLEEQSLLNTQQQQQHHHHTMSDNTSYTTLMPPTHPLPSEVNQNNFQTSSMDIFAEPLVEKQVTTWLVQHWSCVIEEFTEAFKQLQTMGDSKPVLNLKIIDLAEEAKKLAKKNKTTDPTSVSILSSTQYLSNESISHPPTSSSQYDAPTAAFSSSQTDTTSMTQAPRSFYYGHDETMDSDTSSDSSDQESESD